MKNNPTKKFPVEEIPFSRMIVISSKWVFAALPAVVIAYLGMAWIMVQFA